MSDRLALLRPFLADAMAHAMAIQQCEQRAADSVQQVLAKAMFLSDMPHESQHLKAWFLRSVHNAAIDVIRHERKEQPIDSETEEQSAPVSIEPDCQLETWQTQQWVRTGLQKLSTEQREILMLRDIFAAFRNIVGGEIHDYTKLLAESREQALDRLVDEARSLDADAVIDVRFSTSMLAHGAAELLAYGTAVKLLRVKS
ncbi:hypothetical protein CWI82_06220 [Pseudidiomarina tainanensis]|uniref:Uncharacterized protein n=1 Tax=Pseudidiomarina tainanensis TaxID=502365 RepID=A0ACD2HJW8_9GAMM|nr:heavy metal-binding domain-containing protein [Pseudidiomarina tainanensis]RZQ56871.1 hypothetical protein CWI82_06220 [Pseudidiomarina tainanensis]